MTLTFDYNASEAERLWGLVCDRPDSDMAVWFGVGYLATRHRVGDVIGLLDRAMQRDPLNGLFRCILGYFLEWQGMHDRAFAEARRCIELDQNYWGGHFIATAVYTAQGLLADALASAETAYRVAPWHTRIVGQLAGVLARRGQRERSDGLLRQMRAADVAAGIPIGMIQYHVTSGELDGAIDWFERAVEEREPLVTIYANEPQVKRFQSGPRWTALLETMNLPEAS